MLQRDAEKTLMELTQGLSPSVPMRTARKRITVAAAKAAGFIEAGSGLLMSVASEELGTKEGQFWEVKGDVNDAPYLERMSYDVDPSGEKNEKQAATQLPDFFSTLDEMYEWFSDNGGTVNQVETNTFEGSVGGSSATYEEQGDKISRVATDHEEELQRRADIGNEPPKRTIPESVELDVSNKYKEQGENRELSLSERSDLSEVDEDLEKKGLTGLEFD